MKTLQGINMDNIKQLGMGMLIGISLTLPMSSAMAKGGPQGGPPQEAFTACENLTEGTACSVSTPRGEMSGSCKGPREGEGALACVPEKGRSKGRPKN